MGEAGLGSDGLRRVGEAECGAGGAWWAGWGSGSLTAGITGRGHTQILCH
jgi:hypothetical protein